MESEEPAVTDPRDDCKILQYAMDRHLSSIIDDIERLKKFSNGEQIRQAAARLIITMHEDNIAYADRMRCWHKSIVDMAAILKNDLLSRDQD
jgi:hypothetical protein